MTGRGVLKKGIVFPIRGEMRSIEQERTFEMIRVRCPSQSTQRFTSHILLKECEKKRGSLNPCSHASSYTIAAKPLCCADLADVDHLFHYRR